MMFEAARNGWRHDRRAQQGQGRAPAWKVPARSRLGLGGGLTIAALACGDDVGSTEPLAGAAELPVTVYPPERLTSVDIELDADDWRALRRDGRSMAHIMRTPSAVFDYTRFPAEVVIDGVRHPRATVRKKGFIGSLSALRPSLKITTVNPMDQAGTVRLTLNNDLQDRSHTRQCMAYALFARARLPTPRCTFARVTVNGEDLGVYTNVEPIRPPLLERHFGDGHGALWEGALSDFDAESVGSIEAKNEAADERGPLQAVVDAL